MTHFGSPEEWTDFLESQVPAILSLVIETWEAMPPPAGNELEDTVSEALCKALRQSRTCRELPLRIDTQLVELDPAAGEDQGRMDIVFSPLAPREDIYFCLECKRLNVREPNGVRPYFAEYVKFGIFRFVRGQYARSVRFGGMLAFVLDGDVAGAIAGVAGNLNNHHRDLGMAAPGEFRTSAAQPNDDRVRETEHRRGADLRLLVIQHLFVAGDSKAPLRPPSAPKPTAKPRRKKPGGSPARKGSKKRELNGILFLTLSPAANEISANEISGAPVL